MQDADVAIDSEEDEVYEQNLVMVRKYTDLLFQLAGMDAVLRNSIAHCSPEGNLSSCFQVQLKCCHSNQTPQLSSDFHNS